MFSKIEETDKTWCENEFNLWIGGKSNFVTELENIRNSFMQWRYLYEKGWTDTTSLDHIRSGSVSEFMELLRKIAHRYLQDSDE